MRKVRGEKRLSLCQKQISSRLTTKNALFLPPSPNHILYCVILELLPPRGGVYLSTP